MGLFSGLISLFNYLIALAFLFVVGFIAGVVACKYVAEKYCPKTFALLKAEYDERNYENAYKTAQKEDTDGVVWTE